jgi:3-oxoacyl-[acyl-carrier protein] reductase
VSEQRVLVTGAGAGIGFATARLLAARGYDVAVNDLDADRAETAAAALARDGTRAVAVPGDVSDTDTSLAVVAAAADALGGLTGLVNNAGTLMIGRLDQVSVEAWDRVMAVNLTAAMLCSRHALARFPDAGGAIVNVASIAAFFASPNLGSYSASKAGVMSLTQQSAIEWGVRGVRVNAVAPGLISGTGMTADIDDDLAGARARIIPLAREGKGEDVARVVAFLLSDDARYVSGQTIGVDGGLNVAALTMIPRPPR